MIGRNTKNFTGFILQDNEKICFHMQDRIFNFISEEVGLVAAFKKKTIISQEYFLHGYTSDGYQIAVYTGYEKRNISANYKLRPGLYIISKSSMNFYDMTKFQAIEFIGGTLNNLYQQTVIETKYDDSQKCYIKKYPESRKEYNLKIKEYDCKLVLRNIPSEKSPSKMDLVLRYEFSEEIPLKFIKNIYHILLEICRFMTNRKNVGFDDVRLFQIDKETGKWLCFGDGFIDCQYDNLTEKSYKANILFDDMNDCIFNIHSIIAADTERIATYSFEFYASSDADYTVLSDDKIKNICSSIECELNFIEDLENDENENLTDLIKKVKCVIKEHRKSDKKLEDRTYDMIYSSISHWDMANSRRIFLLYTKNKEYMDILQERANLSCNEDDIATFVKFRNDITHGRYRTVDSVVAKTSFTLMALSYCCFLIRMGMGQRELKKLFEENRIGS